MDWVLGFTYGLIGFALAFFIAGVPLVTLIVLVVLGGFWFVLTAHLTGIRKGEKRVATDL